MLYMIKDINFNMQMSGTIVLFNGDNYVFDAFEQLIITLHQFEEG